MSRLELDHDLSNHASMMLLKLIGSFARRLMFNSAVSYHTEKQYEPKEETKFKVMVPLHVVSAIVHDPLQYDFLTDEGLARYTSMEMIDANALNDDPSAPDILAQLEPRLKLHRLMAAADSKAHVHSSTHDTHNPPNDSNPGGTERSSSMDTT